MCFCDVRVLMRSEQEYFTSMQEKCNDEKKKAERLKKEAKKNGGAAQAQAYHHANTMEMPSCDKIEAIRRGQTV